MTVYIDPEQALAVVQRLGFEIRDAGLLFSALARPATSVYGTDAYPSLELKGAALLTSVVSNHSLFDGNKRLSWFLTMAFFDMNDRHVRMPSDDAFDLVLAIARGELELDVVARRLAGATR